MSFATRTPRDDWGLWASHAATISALVFQLLEYLNDLPLEVEFFSKTLTNQTLSLNSAPTIAKSSIYLYTWSRYFGLIAQICTLALTELSNRRGSWKLCMSTFIARGVCLQLMISCIEAILMLRVHALYSRNHTVGRILLTIFTIGTLCQIFGSGMAVRNSQPIHNISVLHQYSTSGEVCGTTQLHPGPLVLYAFGSTIVQGTIIISMLRKVVSDRSSRWFRRSPAVSLMVRDGIAIFIMFFAIISSILSVELVQGQGPLMWNVSSAWFLALLSVGGCRLILNMRKLSIARTSTLTHSPETASMEETSTCIEFTH